jgi:hypothetical protein
MYPSVFQAVAFNLVSHENILCVFFTSVRAKTTAHVMLLFLYFHAYQNHRSCYATVSLLPCVPKPPLMICYCFFTSMPTKTTAHVMLLFLSLKFLAATHISSYYCRYYDHAYHQSYPRCIT